MRGKRRPNPNTTLLMKYIIVYPRRTVYYYRLYIFSQISLPLFLCSLRPSVIFHERSLLLFTAGSRVARSLIPVALAGKQSSISVHSYLPIAPPSAPPLSSSSALVPPAKDLLFPPCASLLLSSSLSRSCLRLLRPSPPLVPKSKTAHRDLSFPFSISGVIVGRFYRVSLRASALLRQAVPRAWH